MLKKRLIPVLILSPRSAGAQPGPACYGQGGVEPTVTDANLLLGRLGAGNPLGGKIALDVKLAEQAIAPLAASLDMDVHALAEGIVRIAVARISAPCLSILSPLVYGKIVSK